MTEEDVALEGDAEVKSGEPGISPPQEKPDKKPQKEHEPPQDHPRFKEVYGKMREYERQVAQRNEDIELLKKHNQDLADAMATIEDKVTDIGKPDKETNPEEYEKWLIEKGKREALKAVKTKPVSIPATPPPTDPHEAAMRISHDDYDAVIAVVNADMHRDPVLRNDIMSRPPEERYKEAYKYGTERIARMNRGKQQSLEQSYVEGANSSPKEPKGKLTDKEKYICKKLGVSEENFLKQKEFIENRGGR